MLTQVNLLQQKLKKLEGGWGRAFIAIGLFPLLCAPPLVIFDCHLY